MHATINPDSITEATHSNSTNFIVAYQVLISANDGKTLKK